VEKGLPLKEECWRRAGKEKEMWRPSKSEDNDPLFPFVFFTFFFEQNRWFDSHYRILFLFFYLENRKL
jgi:hypothetical protein